MDVEKDDLLTPKQVADRFIVHPVTLARWRTSNRGPAWIELEGQIRYKASEVRAYLERQAKAPDAA